MSENRSKEYVKVSETLIITGIYLYVNSNDKESEEEKITVRTV